MRCSFTQKPVEQNENKSMQMIKTLGLTLAAAGMMAITAQAVPIAGNLSFGSFNPLSLTGGAGTFLTATGFDFPAGDNAIINLGSTGDFLAQGAVFPALAQFHDFTFAPLPVGGADPVWTVSAGGFSFALHSVTVSRTATSISLTGVGIVSSTVGGLDDNSGDFQFTVQGNSAVETIFSFSADNHSPSRTPDGGSTLILLGSSIAGLFCIARKSLRIA